MATSRLAVAWPHRPAAGCFEPAAGVLLGSGLRDDFDGMRSSPL